ncbi:Major Facilitator Superfamily, partial [Rhizoctonia solani]
MADPNQLSASSASIHSDVDIEASTPNTASDQDSDAKQPEEVVDGLASVQASGSTAHLVSQVNEDDFVEGGLEGWTAVLGCTLVIAVTGGVLTLLFTSCFETHSTVTHKAGAYHSKTLLKGTSHAKLSAIGASQNMIMYVLAFFTGKLGDKYGYKRFIATGCIITFLGQFGASWSRDLWSIFLTQGLLQGLGCGSLLPMISAIPSQWFRRRRGVATGIVVAGASFGGAVSSLVVQAMLERLGFHKTLLIYSLVQGGIMLVGFSLIKTRFPASQIQNKQNKIVWFDKQYFKDPVFWSICSSLMFTMFGFLVPFVFISVYTREKLPQLSDQLTNLPIPVMNFASAFGRTAVGLMGDRIGFVNTFILIVLASSFCQAVLWNVATESYAGIIVFSVLYGITGPSFIGLVGPAATKLYGTHNLATLIGLLNVFYIPGSIGGSPLAGLILDTSTRNWHVLTAYSGLVQFLGVLCILYGESGLALVRDHCSDIALARITKERRVFAKI